MSFRLFHDAQRWSEQRVDAVVVEVWEALGSTPRDSGTRMLVSSNEAVGTIGGGHLEAIAIAHARSLLTHGSGQSGPVPLELHLPLGPALGQCCGGAVRLRFEPLGSEALARWPVPAPMFRLQLYGAGHVGRAIVGALSALDVHIDWIDEREDEFPSRLPGFDAWPAHIDKVCVDSVEGEVRLAEPGTFYLVLTHDHDLDMRIVEAILRRGDFGFLGLIGSKTKRQRFLSRLGQRGIDASALDRLTCPIGIDGIDGKQPEVIALAVAAQLLQICEARTRT